MSERWRLDPLGRGLFWTLTSYLVSIAAAFVGWVYFFVLNRTRIVRPYRGSDRPNTMFAANHQSPIDTAFIGLAAWFPRLLWRPRLHPWSAAAAEYWFAKPKIAWLADRLRCLPARTGADHGVVRALCRVLAGGTTIFFPEGKRSVSGAIGPARAGAGFIALQTGARIVPVAVDGLLDAMPHRAPRPHIGKRLTIAFGDPVPYDDLRRRPITRASAQELADRCLDAVRDLHRALPAPPTDARRRYRRRATFQEKVVWVTGASSGIGREIALELHRQSATVILSARNVAALRHVARACTGGAPVHVLPLDLTRPESIEDAARSALAIAGHLDCVVHGAGVAARATVAETSLAVDRQVMETNYLGPVALTKAVLPAMQRRQSGTFVVISSITGRVGVPRLSAYAASKHALHGFFESLRAEVRRDNIRVSIVTPGFINTAIAHNALTGNGGRFGKSIAVHVQGMPADVCARHILDGVAVGRQEFAVGGIEVLSLQLLRVSRRLVAWLVRSHPFRLAERLRTALLAIRPGCRPERQIQDDEPRSW